MCFCGVLLLVSGVGIVVMLGCGGSLFSIVRRCVVRKYVIPKLDVFEFESFDREREVLTCSLEQIGEFVDGFEVDEFLIPRVRRDPLWEEGMVPLGEVLLAAYGEGLAEVEFNETGVRALTDLVLDVEEFVSPFDQYVAAVAGREDVNSAVREVLAAEEERPRVLAEEIEAARRRVDEIGRAHV